MAAPGTGPVIRASASASRGLRVPTAASNVAPQTAAGTVSASRGSARVASVLAHQTRPVPMTAAGGHANLTAARQPAAEHATRAQRDANAPRGGVENAVASPHARPTVRVTVRATR